MNKYIADPKGNRLQRVLLLGAALTILAIGWFSVTNFIAYRFVTGPLPGILRLSDVQRPIQRLDESLTMSAWMFVATGDIQWKTRYLRFAPRLETALAEIVNLSLEPQYRVPALQSQAAANQLLAMGNRSIALVEQGQSAQARALMSGEAYLQQKSAFSAAMTDLNMAVRQMIDSLAEGRRLRLLVSLIFAAVAAPLLVLGWWLVLRGTRQWQSALLEDNQQLVRQKAELDAKVSELVQAKERAPPMA